MTFSFLEKPVDLMAAHELSDAQLFSLCRDYGERALLWRQKFMGLLPEVERRQLYLAHGFGSVFEFAARLAGLSEQQVRTTLNLYKRFADKPALKALLEGGVVSVNKLVRVQSVATVESEGFWAQQVQVLPQKAIETLVRDGKPQEPLRAQDLKLGEAVTERLLELQEKGIDLDELLEKLLDQREEAIEEEKAAIAAGLEPAKSRAVPVRTQRVLDAEHGTKCSISTCKKPSEEIHHSQTFAMSKRHDPRYLAPLCKEHHIIAHGINVKVQEKRRF